MHLTSRNLKRFEVGLASILVALAVAVVPCKGRPSEGSNGVDSRSTTESPTDGRKENQGIGRNMALNTGIYHFHPLSPGKMTRISRSAEGGFYPPSLKNRVHGRAAGSRFHEGGHGPRPLGVGNHLGSVNTLIPSGYGSPIARMLVAKDSFGGVGGEIENLEETDPTFTPYISARVFNMPQFLDHLKGNLESMTEGEDFPSDEAEFDENDFESLGFGLNGEILPSSGNDAQFSPEPQRGILRWRPASFIGSRPRNRNMLQFVQDPPALESNYKNHLNPARNGYEFGLG